MASFDLVACGIKVTVVMDFNELQLCSNNILVIFGVPNYRLGQMPFEQKCWSQGVSALL
jgi:hypothetical protein